jgi:predicted N-acetyltransferase YhbS
MREVRAAGYDALMLATDLLHRVRRTDPGAGLWEAADVQWWWRRPRLSDDVEKVFWVDDDGPVAGVLLTSWRDDDWQCDPLVVPGAPEPGVEVVWDRAQELIETHFAGEYRVGVHGEDSVLRELVEDSGLTLDWVYASAWMAVTDRPTRESPAEGFVVVDRTQRVGVPHQMRHRNGAGVVDRLAQAPLYAPDLDLAVETTDGREAGYVLFWFDPMTLVGLVEPVRIEDEFKRRGLARTLLTVGIERLAAKGSERIKIGWGEAPAAALYQGVGFRKTSDDFYFKGPRPK